MRVWLPSILTPHRGDFMPILIGGTMLVLAFPAFLMLLFDPDQHSGGVATGLLLVMGGLSLIGAVLLVAGVRACSDPGSLPYRLSHGRVAWPRSRTGWRA